MYIQTLSFAKPKVFAHLEKHPSARLKTIYKNLRKLTSLDLFGDWVLLSEAVHRAAEVGRLYSRLEISRACKLATDSNVRSLRSHSVLVRELAKEAELSYIESGFSIEEDQRYQ